MQLICVNILADDLLYLPREAIFENKFVNRWFLLVFRCVIGKMQFVVLQQIDEIMFNP